MRGLHGCDSTPHARRRQSAANAARRLAAPARSPRRALRSRTLQIVREVERRHHRDALRAGDLAAFANLAHPASRNATASSSSAALGFLARNLVVAAEQRDVERDRCVRARQARFGRHSAASGSRASSASSALAPAATRSASAWLRVVRRGEVAPQRFVRRAQRSRVRDQRRELALERRKLARRSAASGSRSVDRARSSSAL